MKKLRVISVFKRKKNGSAYSLFLFVSEILPKNKEEKMVKFRTATSFKDT